MLAEAFNDRGSEQEIRRSGSAYWGGRKESRKALRETRMSPAGLSLYGIEVFQSRERRKLDLGSGSRGLRVVRNIRINKATRVILPWVKLTLVTVFIVVKII